MLLYFLETILINITIYWILRDNQELWNHEYMLPSRFIYIYIYIYIYILLSFDVTFYSSRNIKLHMSNCLHLCIYKV